MKLSGEQIAIQLSLSLFFSSSSPLLCEFSFSCSSGFYQCRSLARVLLLFVSSLVHSVSVQYEIIQFTRPRAPPNFSHTTFTLFEFTFDLFSLRPKNQKS